MVIKHKKWVFIVFGKILLNPLLALYIPLGQPTKCVGITRKSENLFCTVENALVISNIEHKKIFVQAQSSVIKNKVTGGILIHIIQKARK